MNWDKYRNATGAIDLVEVYLEKNPQIKSNDMAGWTAGCELLSSLVALQPINSRQVAALALANAAVIDTLNPGAHLL